MTANPRATELIDLDCRRCGLCRGRRQVVPAEGLRSARLFLVGEAPGPDEDREGRPFVGRAGRILRRCLQAAGVPAVDAWISNAVKCFPNEASNGKRRIRRPRRDEQDACRAFLASELEVVDPRLVVAVGATAVEALTGRRDVRLTRDHGTLLPSRPELGGRDVFVTFHPSGLRYGHASERDLVVDLGRAYSMAMAQLD